ncbi:A/G-specific adenine glycosylase [Thermus thermamylovorans]|uniref:Adenine DNA glycosylase n=1 Tax=Thermus thermamylovorans TaxID=2509362 RepID=A0A4Q9AWU7_9DEIN|nr:A/G-specific adenine glycosylase [Thermus thermamylovorans]TBH15916.1 A/G-specific adenine glycosylase [Thermus thermamylovorans]
MEAWQKALLAWYRAQARLLPWRGEKDPYRVLVAEVLLQQTRVAQAIPYYRRFLERFPTLKALRGAPLEEVLKAWQGAGYYRRAANLHRLAQEVEALPRSYAELLKLPGLGPYTAAAVASIAFGERVAAVDGNVRRVLSRVFALENPAPKVLWELAQGLLPEAEDPGAWNQALMDLGAEVCLPRGPRCTACPLEALCRGKEAPERFPRPRRRRVQEEILAALVLLGRKGVHLERLSGRFQGLYGVPLFPLAELPQRAEAFGVRPQPAGEVRHAVTHRRLRVQVYLAPWDGEGEDPRGRPLPKLMEKVLRQAQALLAHEGVVPLPHAKPQGVEPF